MSDAAFDIVFTGNPMVHSKEEVMERKQSLLLELRAMRSLTHFTRGEIKYLANHYCMVFVMAQLRSQHLAIVWLITAIYLTATGGKRKSRCAPI